jgi:hypothetical protein
MLDSPKQNKLIVAETILIELVVDDSQLQPAIDLLEKTGQIDSKLANGFRQTTAEINKQAQAIKADAAATTPLKKNLEDINKATKNVSQSFMQGFQEGVIDTLKEAGVSVKEFTDALGTGATEVSAPTESLRTRLKNLTAQIAELKLSGQDNTEQFRELVIEAGRVRDAMNDAGQEIRNVASDTGTFDGIISGLQGVTGAAQIGQGVTALFGEESEELQKTLLRVNAVMAIGQGLQQVQNVLQKESAASRLADTIAAKAQIVVQRIYTAVTGQATAATTAFKVALATTGIGLLVVGILALAQALNDQDDALEDVNRELERNKALIEADTAAIERRTEIAVAEAQKAGKVESDLTKIRGQGLLAQRAAILEANKDLARQRDALSSTSNEFFELNKRIEENAEAIKKIDTDLILANINFQKQLAEEVRKAAIATAETALTTAAEGSKRQLEIRKRLISLQAQADIHAAGLTEEQKTAILAKAEKMRQELQIAFNKRQIDAENALIEARLISIREGSQEEFNLKLQQLRLQTQSELQSTQLSEAEKKAIKEKGFQEELKLQKEFIKRLTKEAIEGQVSLNNAQLASVATNTEDRLLLSIANIELQAEAEILAANKNANKIKEIQAKRDADIATTRKEFIEQQAEQEIALRIALEGENNRSLERIAVTEVQKIGRITLKEIQENNRRRIIAIQQLAEFELGNIERRERALEEEREKRLIGEKEYNLRYAQLQDEKSKVSEDTEKKITGIHQSESEKRRKIDQETIELALDIASQVGDILSELADQKEERDQQRVEAERARVQELLESGAITEKEAVTRNKRIDAEEKRLKTEAARRNKALAIFDSIIATAQAVVRALAVPPAPNFVLAAIAGAFGAAQTALIAARPIPKFKGGKKNKYQGPGIIGEDGAEIFEHDGKRYIAHKETLVWMGKDDKVYTPQETKRMLPRIDRELMKPRANETVVVNGIDYDALGKAVGKHVKLPGVTVDENGFKVWQQEGMSRVNYMNKYYSSPK